MELLVGVAIFLVVVLLFEGGYLAVRALRNPEVARVRRRLRTLRAGGAADPQVDIIRKEILSTIPWFNRMLFRIPRLRKVNLLLEQADTDLPLGFYLLLSFVLGGGSLVLGYIFEVRTLLLFVAAAALASTPFLYLSHLKKKRMAKFERQLPEALELIARSLKAGHAFSSGLKIASEEFDDPLGTEFEKTMAEINFGIAVPEALRNLTVRVDCPDLKFFALSVIIQRETGGNLAEIIENIGYLIRERFKLQGRIRILSAEGRLSATVLTALPFVVGFYFYIIRPQYISTLFTDPVGKILLTVALVNMAIGILIMRRMVNFKV